MANDRLAALEAKLEARSLQRDNDIAGLREDLASVAESLRAAAAVHGELARRISILESVPRPSILSYWGPAIATAATLGAAMGWALDERVTPIKELAVDAQADTRALSGLYGELARNVARDEEKLRWHDEWIGSVQAMLARLDGQLAEVRVEEAARQ